MDVDFVIEDHDFDLGRVVNEDNKRIRSALEDMFEDYLNKTEKFLSYQHGYIKDVFDSVLEMKWNESMQLSTQQSNFIDSLNSLNDSIMDQLNEDKTKIDGAKEQFDNAVYVGDKVDTSNLTLNFDDIQSSLTKVINQFNNRYDNSSLVQLYHDKGEFHDQLDDVFENAVERLRDIDISIDDNDDVSYILKIEPNLIDSSISQHNKTNGIQTNFNIESFRKKSATNLVIIGIFLCLAYFLIMLYQYFRFRYQMSYTVSSMVEIEKTNEKLDYFGILQDTNEPTVTMLMNFQTKMFGKLNEVKTFWMNSFMIGDISNLPYMIMFCMFLFIVFLSLSKLEIGDVSLDTSTNVSMIFEKTYNLTAFDGIEDTVQLQKSVNSWNNQTQVEIEALNDSLEDLYKKFNISSLLSLSAPALHAQNFMFLQQNSTTTGKLLSALQQTQYQIKSSTNVSNFQTSKIVQAILHMISSTLVQIVRTALVIAAILFFFVVALGVLYSFVM